MADPIQVITIPRYLTRIQVARARRAKYFTKTSIKIPKKYDDLEFNRKGFLVDIDGNRIIANPRTAGKPRYETLSGNKLTSGYATPFTRTMISNKLKDFYRPFVKSMRVMTDLPIRMEWDFYTTVDKPNFDLSNFWFYLKYFEDTLVSEGIIPDDSVQFITHSASPRLIPVNKFAQRKFVFRFYHDDRSVLNHPVWDKTKQINDDHTSSGT